MSDHISGPRAIADPVIDITDVYAFPCPESPRHLIVIMNVFPYAGPSAVFSDAVIYRLRVRSVSIAPDQRAFVVAADESTFNCTFSGTQAQECRCTLPNGDVITFRANDESGGKGKGLADLRGTEIRSILPGRPNGRKNHRNRTALPSMKSVTTGSTARMSCRSSSGSSGRPCSREGRCLLWSAKP